MAGSCQCESVTAIGIAVNAYSYQYPGLSVEGAILAQERRVGVSTGLAVSPIRYKINYIEVTNGKETRGQKTVSGMNMLAWAEMLYKIMQKDYSHSIHIVLGSTFDDYKDVSLHMGLNLRIPDGNKAYYAQIVCRTDKVVALRIGIYLP